MEAAAGGVEHGNSCLRSHSKVEVELCLKDQEEQGQCLTRHQIQNCAKGFVVFLTDEKEEELLMRPKEQGQCLAHHRVPREA